MEKQVYNYEYYFEKHGETCRRRGNNEIWVDVGNKLEVGIFDHHDNGYESTAQVLVGNIELLKLTVENLISGETIYFHTHGKPDMDALVSIFLFKEYIEKGEAYFYSMYCEENAKGKALIEYTNLIDQGKNKVISRPTLYALLSTLDSKQLKALWKNDKELSHNMVRKGLEWIQEYVDALCAGEHEKPYDIELCLECDEEFQIAYKDIIQRSKTDYEIDKKSNQLMIETIPLWTKTNEIRENVKAVIWKDIPSSEYSYLYAREEGADLTFVPYSDEQKQSNGVRVSINPDKKENAELSLLAVADVYERMEQISEKEDFLNNKGLRRDYSKSRGENLDSIFKKVPFVETEDPWYISDKEDMIDVPKKHRDFKYNELIEVVENITDMVEATYLVEIDRTIEKTLSANARVSQTGRESLFQWNARLTEALAKDMDKKYKLAIVRIGSGLIMHNYDLLDSYYMSLIGGSYVEKE